MADNENTTTADTPGSISDIGIPVITMEVNAAETVPNAVDPTLTNTGEAAEAAAVGARFDTVEENVSGISYDIYGTDSTDPECLRIEQRLEAVEETMIPKSDISTTFNTAGKVADAKAVGDNMVPKTDISTTLDTTGKVADAKAVGDAIAALNGSTLKYAGTGNDTIKSTVDAINVAQPFAVSFAAGSATRDTVEDARITAQHVVASVSVNHPADISWTTQAEKIIVECASGIPAMTLMLCLPVSHA